MSSLEKLISQKVGVDGLKGNSFFVFNAKNPWRQLAYFVSFHQYTATIMYVLIMANSITMAIVTPIDDPDSLKVKIVNICDVFVLSMFALEMVLKMIALGAFLGPYSYWNISTFYRLDFLVVVGSILGSAIESRGFESIRAFRAVRIFRAIKYIDGFRDIMSSLKSGISLVVDNSAFMGFFFLVFGVLSVELFQNTLSRWCVMEDAFANGVIEEPLVRQSCKPTFKDHDVSRGNCPDGMLCAKLDNERYYSGKAHFDDLFHAVVIIWQVSTLSGWTEHVYHIQEGEGSTVLPALYFFLLIFCLNYVVVNLFVAVVGAVFGRVRDVENLEHPSLFFLSYDSKKAWNEVRKRKIALTLKWGIISDDITQTCESWGSTATSLPINKRKDHKMSPWELLRLQLVPYVQSRALLVFVVLLTLANAALKATDGADVSEEHKSLLRTADYVFTALLALELVIRFCVTGRSSVKVFLSSSWDLFDAIVLIFSVISLIFAGTSLSFFRLRVLQLAFYYEGLRPVQNLFNRSVAGIPGAISIVGLITVSFFVFGVVGMQFLAGRMLGEEDGKRMRLHFDHFFSSQLLLFQVMSGDTWEAYMRTAWFGNGLLGVFFIVFFYMFSVWVLLNLFTAVVLENFDKDDMTKYEEQVLQYKEQTMSFKKRSARSQTDTFLGKVWKKIAAFLATPEEIKKQREEALQEDSLARELHALLENKTKGDIEALLSDLSLLTQDEQECEMGNVAKMEIGRGEASELEVNTTVDLLSQREDTIQMYISKNHATHTLQSGTIDAEEGETLNIHLPARNLIKEDDVAKETMHTSTEIEYSFFLFHYKGAFRTNLKYFVEHKYYELFIVLVIALSSVTLALEEPAHATWWQEEETQAQQKYKILRTLDWVWLGIFGQEVLLKSLAVGFWGPPWTGKQGYLNGHWNKLDFILIVAMGVTIVLPRLKIVQVFRTLRPIRALRKVQSLHIIVSAIWGALPATFTIVIGMVLWFLLSGIVGIALFAGKFNYCTDTGATGKVDCIGTFVNSNDVLLHRVWTKPVQNFDTIGAAIITLIEVTSLASWTIPMFNAMDITEKDVQPEFMSSPMNSIYFVTVIVICSFFFVNIFVAVILDRIYHEMGISIMTEDQRAWSDFQKTIKLFESKMHGVKPPDFNSSSVRLFLYYFVTHKYFDPFILCLITVNIGFMASKHASQPDYWTNTLDSIDYFFLACYIAEMVVKIIAYGGLSNYFKNRWNSFDAFVVFGSMAAVILKSQSGGSVATVGVVRMLRVARVFKLMNATTGVKFLFRTLMISIPAIFNIFVLSLMLMLIYTVFGKSMFGSVRDQSFIGKNANFRSTNTGLGTVFRVLTLDNWHFLMHDCMVQEPFCTVIEGSYWMNDCGNPAVAAAYFFSFYVVGVYIFINLILAVILDNFGHIFSESTFCLSETDVTDFDDVWCDEDFGCRAELPRFKIRTILTQLHAIGNPLGCDLMAIEGPLGRKRYEFIMFTIYHVSKDNQKDGKQPVVPMVKWRDLLNIATSTYIRFYHTECLKYGQNKQWQAEKKSIEQKLAARKIISWMLAFRTLKMLEKEFGSRVYVIRKIREYLFWRKATEIALAQGRRPPPPPTEKYANIRTQMLQKARKELEEDNSNYVKTNKADTEKLVARLEKDEPVAAIKPLDTAIIKEATTGVSPRKSIECVVESKRRSGRESRYNLMTMHHGKKIELTL